VLVADTSHSARYASPNVTTVSTPILDLQKEPPYPSGFMLGFSLLAGAVIGAFLAMIPAMQFRYLPSCNGLLLFPAYYISVAVHELGHSLLGSIVGMPPGGISIGGFRFFKSGLRWRTGFDIRRIFAGGLAKALPPVGDYRVWAFAFMVAGGPIASLLLSLFTGILGVTVDTTGWNWSGTISWVSALLFFSSLIPYSSGVNRSDGGRLLALARNPGDCRAWMALYALQTQDAGGARPRDWDAELFAEVMKTKPTSNQYPFVQLLAYFRCVDQENEEAGFEHLESALATCKKSGKCFRHAIFLTAAATTAYPRGNGDGARVWLARACRIQKPKSTDGVESAIAMSEHRYSDALRHLSSLRIYLNKLKLSSGLARFSSDEIARYEKICAEGLCTGRPALDLDVQTVQTHVPSGSE
jgi:hypothetical protein